MFQVSAQPSHSGAHRPGCLDILHLLPIVASYGICYVTVTPVTPQNFKHFLTLKNREHILDSNARGMLHFCKCMSATKLTTKTFFFKFVPAVKI